MVQTKLDIQDPHHQILIAVFTSFVEDYGYKPRELFELLEDAKRQTFFALTEIHREAQNNA
ncbi:hypothetical protein PVJ1_00021 [Psychrobacillus phage PVJ1]|nr:hypothetical protein PVJ1_00021 [Psychrobacillus phage PVJ1]